MTTIFVVDDDPDDLEVFQEVVREIDDSIKCIQCADSLMAKQLLQLKIKPDIVFIDINMPAYNGFELLGDLHGDPKSAKLEIAMLSTGMTAEISSKVKAMGARYALAKPGTFREYVDMLRPILARI